ESGHFLEEFPGMPLPSRNWAAQAGNDLIAEQLNYHPDTEREHANNNLVLMNQEQ
ncbi:hypothetical protein F5880DRAFT_1464980, partial [Lentinula raphanica]